ncbi:MAG: hypothetical protein JSU00_20430 [Acidobacteria bacterium]|nr:hypothetical protein [Acidobacteriota bacterium]
MQIFEQIAPVIVNKRHIREIKNGFSAVADGLGGVPGLLDLTDPRAYEAAFQFEFQLFRGVVNRNLEHAILGARWAPE